MVGTTPITVLTGDIVKSTKMEAGALATLREVIMSAADEAAGWSVGGKPSARAEFFRGDSWQAVMGADFLGLRAALFIRAHAIKAGGDTRIAISVGEAKRVDPERVSLSTGPVFERSGRALDAMKPRRLVLDDAQFLKGVDVWVSAAVGLCDEIVGRWTKRQAEFLCMMLDGAGAAPQQEIALEFGVSQQAVSHGLAAAGWNAIEHLLEVYETGGLGGRSP